MRYPALRFRVSPDTTVRLLLTAAMALALGVMVLLSNERAIAQDTAQEPHNQALYGMPRDEIVARLDGKYKEASVAGGLATNGNILEVFATPDGRSWTIIVTRPDGMSSVIAEGEGWSFLTAVKGLRV